MKVDNCFVTNEGNLTKTAKGIGGFLVAAGGLVAIAAAIALLSHYQFLIPQNTLLPNIAPLTSGLVGGVGLLVSAVSAGVLIRNACVSRKSAHSTHSENEEKLPNLLGTFDEDPSEGVRRGEEAPAADQVVGSQDFQIPSYMPPMVRWIQFQNSNR